MDENGASPRRPHLGRSGVVALSLVGCMVVFGATPAGEGAAHPDDATVRVPDPTPDCGRTNIASDEYGTAIDPVTGPPGTQVTLSGTTVRGEDWRWAPSDRLEAWWNTDVPVAHGRPIADGPVLRLVRVEDMERCRFEATFTVPDVEPGRYQISVLAWDADPSEGYGWFLPHHFTVTDDG